MEKTSEDLVVQARQWAMSKVEEVESIGAKDAIYKEFEEWIEVDENDEDLEILSLEPIEDDCS